MDKLREKAAALLADGTVTMVLGYEEGTNKPRPVFCHTAEQASKLVYSSQCINNLAVYLTKKDIMGAGKVAVIATIPTLRSILQLSVENQLNEENLLVITVTDKDEVKQFANFAEIEAYMANFELKLEGKEQEIINKLEGMSREERFKFWMEEMSHCFKCYACRAACPLCYCTKCIVEENRPQWINPWASPLANMEWQINRAMHMAGRCTGCGACGDACPVGIPIHLLTRKMIEDLAPEFGFTPGQPSKNGNALSTWKADDKENFIR